VHLTRSQIRFIGMLVAAVMATIYYLIGLGVLTVGTSATGDMDRNGMFVFGFMAGSAFLLGAILLGLFDRRWLWVTGLVFQLFVYAMYMAVAPNRNPQFEVWGITLRIIQLPLLLALAYLAWKPAARETRRASWLDRQKNQEMMR